ncbi:MAG: succinate dehydrogenase assembly factor 4 [Gammaproteobacteria bacterium]
MQNPAETRNPVDNEVEVASPRERSMQDAAPVSGSHSTPPPQPLPREVGGPSGPEPTRYGDWERKGRCIDF